MNVLRAVSENGIIAIGMTMIILLGDIDLSVGSVVGLVSTGSAALMVVNGLGFIPTVVLSLGIGAVYGLFNGVVTTKMRIQAFIATLASMNIARGLARFWSNGIGIPLTYGIGPGLAAPEFEFLQARIGGVLPVPALVFLVLIVAFWVVLKYTRFGRQSTPSAATPRRRTCPASTWTGSRSSPSCCAACCRRWRACCTPRRSARAAPTRASATSSTPWLRWPSAAPAWRRPRPHIRHAGGALILGLLDNMLGLKGVNSNLQLVVKGLPSSSWRCSPRPSGKRTDPSFFSMDASRAEAFIGATNTINQHGRGKN